LRIGLLTALIANLFRFQSFVSSSDAFALNSIVAALYSQGKYGEAISYLDKALDIDPNYQLALNAEQSALSKMGR
jgi:tetratricopeptide (TPR) repeat protein